MVECSLYANHCAELPVKHRTYSTASHPQGSHKLDRDSYLNNPRNDQQVNTVTQFQGRKAGLPCPITPPKQETGPFFPNWFFRLREGKISLFTAMGGKNKNVVMSACSLLVLWKAWRPWAPGGPEPWEALSAHSYHSWGSAQRRVWRLLQNVLYPLYNSLPHRFNPKPKGKAFPGPKRRAVMT